MKHFIIVVLLALGAWQGYELYQSRRAAKAVSQETSDISQQFETSAKQLNDMPTRQFKCDGRTHCSQMKSCEEATFFLQNCPGVKMDGDNDGIPCEKQWC